MRAGSAGLGGLGRGSGLSVCAPCSGAGFPAGGGDRPQAHGAGVGRGVEACQPRECPARRPQTPGPPPGPWGPGAAGGQAPCGPCFVPVWAVGASEPSHLRPYGAALPLGGRGLGALGPLPLCVQGHPSPASFVGGSPGRCGSQSSSGPSALPRQSSPWSAERTAPDGESGHHPPPQAWRPGSGRQFSHHGPERTVVGPHGRRAGPGPGRGRSSVAVPHRAAPQPHTHPAPACPPTASELHHGHGREDTALADGAAPVPRSRPGGAQPLGPALQRQRGRQEGPRTCPRPGPQQLPGGTGVSVRCVRGGTMGGRVARQWRRGRRPAPPCRHHSVRIQPKALEALTPGRWPREPSEARVPAEAKGPPSVLLPGSALPTPTPAVDTGFRPRGVPGDPPQGHTLCSPYPAGCCPFCV